MSFIAAPKTNMIATANPPAKDAEGVIGNDGFFPDIDRERMREELRLDGTVTIERLAPAIEAAMWAVNAELREWQAEQLSQGHATLAAVPAPTMGAGDQAESVKLKQYRRAIYFHVQAQLAEAYRDMSTLPQGAGREARVTSAIEIRIDGFNQQLRWAVADLQDKSRVIAALL